LPNATAPRAATTLSTSAAAKNWDDREIGARLESPRHRSRVPKKVILNPRWRAEIGCPLKLEIVQAGNPVLRQRARLLTPAEISTKQIQNLIEAMRDCMREAPGVGLAAPQVGLPLQLAVIEDRQEYMKDAAAEYLQERERRPVPFHVIINPALTEIAGEKAEFFEGCLSLAGFSALVPRARRVRVECLDEQGRKKTIEASGWYARILQHEIDHLHGGLYIDRMRSRTFTSIENWSEFWKSKPVAEIRKTLDLDAV
jgi:peptide deformylase